MNHELSPLRRQDARVRHTQRRITWSSPRRQRGSVLVHTRLGRAHPRMHQVRLAEANSRVGVGRSARRLEASSVSEVAEMSIRELVGTVARAYLHRAATEVATGCHGQLIDGALASLCRVEHEVHRTRRAHDEQWIGQSRRWLRRLLGSRWLCRCSWLLRRCCLLRSRHVTLYMLETFPV